MSHEHDIQSESLTRSRIAYLDIIRSIAILSVVWIHAQEKFNYFARSIGPFDISSLAYLFGRLGVPLFLMLTGALMLPRKINAVRFYKTKLLHLYLLSVFWLFLYRLDSGISIWENLSLSLKLDASTKHLWYLSTLFLIYMFLPYLSNIRYCSVSSIVLLLAALTAILQINLFWPTSIGLNGDIIYFIYLIFGYLITEYKLYEKLKIKYILPLFILSLLLFDHSLSNYAYLSLIYSRGLDIWWYYSPMILLISMLTYVFLARCFMNAPEIRLAKILSSNSFGIFLFHLFVLDQLAPWIESITFLPTTLRTILLTASTLTVSTILSELIGKIPYVKLLIWKK